MSVTDYTIAEYVNVMCVLTLPCLRNAWRQFALFGKSCLGGMQGGFSYSGQRCTAVKVVLAIDKIADELVKKVNEGVAELSVGMPEVCTHMSCPPHTHIHAPHIHIVMPHAHTTSFAGLSPLQHHKAACSMHMPETRRSAVSSLSLVTGTLFLFVVPFRMTRSL